ncbi:MAG: hypothetical protein A2020_02695 [Lentisphaerae bacterium GWF2_45_14]|nr:MAG: hypothetical protein A2020_02695 [Lentisphaerae bacterium GWF2_45_14]
MKNIKGFVDLQMNGFLGIDFSDARLTNENIIFAFRKILEKGTCAFLPTVITASEELYRRNLPMLVEVMRSSEFRGHVPGLHLEGPFISYEPGAVGAHNPEWVRKPDIGFMKRLIEWSEGTIKLLTVAAEAEGVEELISYASSNGITVSIGHQMALGVDVARAVKAGATTVTHLANGIPNMIHRHNNTIWATLAEDALKPMIITDGHHLPPELIKTVIRAKGIDNVSAVSDASSLAGCPPGKYQSMGNDIVLEENGLLHNPAKGCMVGSSACILDCMNYLASLGFLSFDEIMKLGFYNPLKLVKIREEDIIPCKNVYYDEERARFTVKS